jgi:hypothetical protein
MLETRQIALHKIINVRFEGAHASQLALKYHEATQTLEEARDRAAKELTREPTDEVLRGMWLEAMARAADVREKEGAFGEAGDSAPLLDQSIKDYEQLLNEYTAPDDRMERASIQNNLGFALTDKGIRSSGTEATDLLARAEKALRESLSVQSQTVEPRIGPGQRTISGERYGTGESAAVERRPRTSMLRQFGSFEPHSMCKPAWIRRRIGQRHKPTWGAY